MIIDKLSGSIPTHIFRNFIVMYNSEYKIMVVLNIGLMFKLLFLQDIGSLSVYTGMCACKTCIQLHANNTEQIVLQKTAVAHTM